MPSLTPMVWKVRPTRSFSHTAALLSCAGALRCMLQVLPSYPVLTIPTCAFFMSVSERPIPYSIACAAGNVGSLVSVLLYLLSSMDCQKLFACFLFLVFIFLCI